MDAENKQNDGAVDSSAKVNGEEQPAKAGLFNFDRNMAIADAIEAKANAALGIDQDESSDEQDVKDGLESASPSAVKEEGVAKKEPKQKEALDSNKIEQLEKARDAERARRKEANLKLRQAEVQLAELKKLQDEVAALRSLPRQADPTDDNPDDNPVKRELVELKRWKEEQEKAKVQGEQEKQKQELWTKISTTDAALKEKGMPGFRFFVNQVSEAIGKKYEEGEYDFADTQNPEKWSDTYAELFPSFKAEMLQADKDQVMAKKKAAKQKAQLIDGPGRAPDKPKSEEEEEPTTLDDFVRREVEDSLRRKKR